jgi:hypothetical protein
MPNAVEAEFFREIQEVIQIYRVFGEPTPNTMSLLENNDPIEAAKIIVNKKIIHRDFKEFIQMGRERYTIEYLVADPRFLTLFNIPDRANANWRIRQAKEDS